MSSLVQPEWEPFRAKARFFVGEANDYLQKDEVVEISGNKVRFRGMEWHAPNLIRGAKRSGLLVPYKASDVLESAERPKSAMARAIEAKQVSVNILPDGWEEKHWKTKVSDIGKCNDQVILNNIASVETGPVQSAARDRLSSLQKGELAAPVESGPSKAVPNKPKFTPLKKANPVDPLAADESSKIESPVPVNPDPTKELETAGSKDGTGTPG